MCKVTVIAIFAVFLIESGEGLNKYSAEANANPDVTKEPSLNFRNLEKPFRMAKINVLWSKAQLVRGNIMMYIILSLVYMEWYCWQVFLLIYGEISSALLTN